MFSKNKNKTPESVQKSATETPVATPAPATPKVEVAKPVAAEPMKAKPAPSIISSDLKLKGNIDTTGDVQIEGHVVGNVRAHLLTIGQNALIEGEVIADDATVHGKLKGTLRGLKVRLTSSAQVEGDIIHKTISIESGAHFEGSVTRQEDPLSKKADKSAAKE